MVVVVVVQVVPSHVVVVVALLEFAGTPLAGVSVVFVVVVPLLVCVGYGTQTFCPFTVP
ncbi:hypothetical protein ACQCQ5_07425 [Ralstonia pseudosolanacearum]